LKAKTTKRKYFYWGMEKDTGTQDGWPSVKDADSRELDVKRCPRDKGKGGGKGALCRDVLELRSEETDRRNDNLTNIPNQIRKKRRETFSLGCSNLHHNEGGTAYGQPRGLLTSQNLYLWRKKGARGVLGIFVGSLGRRETFGSFI